MKILVALVFIFGAQAALSAPSSSPSSSNCSSILLPSPKAFFQSVAHGLHSVTLEDLRRYFDPDTPVVNGIPTANYDLSSRERPVLTDAPSLRLENDVIAGSDGLRAMAAVLGMGGVQDQGSLLMDGATAMEKIGHQFHMQMVSNSLKKRGQTFTVPFSRNLYQYFIVLNLFYISDLGEGGRGVRRAEG